MSVPDVPARVPNYIEHTFLAWAYDGEAEDGRAWRALERVAAHYARLSAEPLERHASFGARTGLALLVRRDERRRWPLWSEGERSALAWTTAPTGWGAVVGELDLNAAPAELASRLAAEPDLIARLNPPLLVGTREEASEELWIANDFVGAARLYEFAAQGVRVWSNRLGAPAVFAGVEPALDVRAWSVLAATGWILGASTAIAGASKVPSASSLRVRPGPGGTEVLRARSREALELVAPRQASLERSADEAAAAALGLARDLRANWDGALAIDLSGGRDSRISAAGAVATGIDGPFQTVDLEPGEVDVVRELLEKAPRPLEHVVRAAESPTEDDALADRVADYHLVHDGMLNPHSVVRGPLPVPQAGVLPPIVSGHGGELGHGFYYGSKGKLSRAEDMDTPRLVTKLERASRRKRDAAREEGYAAFREEATVALEAGRALGLEGASLLDHYYLTQRLAFRSGLGARNDRASACSTPAFVRACFDLDPPGRLEGRLHPMLVERLVPEWSGVRIFESETAGPVTRSRLYEQPARREELEALIAAPEEWDDVFDPDRVRELWERSREGGGRPHDERILTRIAWRAGFTAHLRTLAAAAGG
ncbi:MAG: hypothetical protein ACR2G3_04705 [Solirubrobacterales bacterium]